MTGPRPGSGAGAIPGEPRRPVVIGTGLIGTSVALALRERGAEVWLADRDPAAARLAADLGAGRVAAAGRPRPAARPTWPCSPCRPQRSAPRWPAPSGRGLARCYTDVASVKELPLLAARALGCDLASFVPGHPHRPAGSGPGPPRPAPTCSSAGPG